MESSVRAVLGCAIAFPVLATVTTCFRIWSRKISCADFGTDDILIIASTLFSIVVSALSATGSIEALNAPPGGYDQSFEFRLFETSNVIGLICIVLVKIAVLWLYKRIFVQHRIQVLVYLFTGLMAIFAAAAITATAIFLPDRRLNPSPSRNEILQVYHDWNILNIVLIIVDIALDIATLCIPIPLIRSLNLPKRRKFMVTAIFLLGALATMSPIIRLGYNVKIFLAYQYFGLYSRKEISGFTVNSNIWSAIEPCTAIMAANLITLRPLLRRIPWKPELRYKLYGVFSSSSRRGARYGAKHNDEDVRPAGHKEAGPENEKSKLARAESRRLQALWRSVEEGEGNSTLPKPTTNGARSVQQMEEAHLLAVPHGRIEWTLHRE